MKTLAVIFIVLGLVACASPEKPSHDRGGVHGVNTYNRLMLKDLDQVNAMVKAHIAQSRAESDKVTPLRISLRIVLSRPDDDGMVDKVIGSLRTELDENEAWESSVTELTEEAVLALKTPATLTPVEQVTYAVLLENVIGQMKPRASDRAFEYANLKRIRDGRLQITPAARSERKMRTMRNQMSPSEVSAQIIQSVDGKSKKATKGSDNE